MKLTIAYPGEYSAWSQMKQRCNNKNHRDYKNYGGRGITVCDQWQTFSAFISDMGTRPHLHTLERIDNNLGYSPKNCRWATRYEQIQNRRNMHFIEYNGVRLTLNGWAKFLGLSTATLYKRKNLNYPIEKLLAPRKKQSGYYR